jgi:hypothetical protein
LLIPAANWKTFLSKTAGLEQVNVGKLSTLQLYPAIAESSVPANIRAIEFDAVVVVVSPPFCMFKPMLLWIAEVMNVSGGEVSKSREGEDVSGGASILGRNAVGGSGSSCVDGDGDDIGGAIIVGEASEGETGNNLWKGTWYG